MSLKGTKLSMMLAVALGIGSGFGGIGSAQATFTAEGPLNGNPQFFLFLNAEKGSPDFSGDVGKQNSGLIFNAVADVPVDVANGYSTIKPSNGGVITSITFTPVDPLAWGDFNFRGLAEGGSSATVSVTVDATQGGTFGPFTFTPANNGDFKRVGATSLDTGESILSITISASDGFDQVKQISVSPCVPNVGTTCTGGGVIPTPEPASLVLLGSGLVALGAVRRRRT